MTLPHEAEAIADIATKYRAELDAMTGLHDAVVNTVSARWVIGKAGIDDLVSAIMQGLLAKACKTFRGIQILCERGLIEDANALVRVLMETTVAIMFILQRKPRERVRIYYAHMIAQNIKMLNEWKRTPRLKRKVPKKALEQANQVLVSCMKKLPAGTDATHHWSGKRNLQEAVKALRGEAMYASLYRFTSATTHASDFGAHAHVEQSSGDVTFQIAPRAQGFEAPSYHARELLWHAASRIDKRLKLGFSAALAPHKPAKPLLRLRPRASDQQQPPSYAASIRYFLDHGTKGLSSARFRFVPR